MTAVDPAGDRVERSGPGINRRWFSPASGEADRLPLVLLHEGLGSIAAWGAFPQALADATGRRLLAHDRIGYGDSGPCPGPWPAEYMHYEARALGQLLAEEGIDRPILVGHSDGASIALLYPSQADDGAPAIAGIVSLSAHVFVEDVGVAAIENLRVIYRDRMAELLARYHRDADSVFDAWSEVWVSQRFRPWTIDAELEMVSCPVLAAQGADDGYGTIEQLERVAAAVTGPSTAHELPGVDHWPHKEAPAGVARLVTRFSDEIDPAPAPTA